jgi:putative protease
MVSTKNKTKKIELLAPAGSLSKLKYVIEFGADAVYVGIPDFSLRVRINNFTEGEIREAVSYAHTRGKKIYVTLNIYAHNQHLSKIEKHLEFLAPLGVDGIIVSDPGIINLVKEHLPEVEIHLSTQANATNWQAVKFWADLGVKRIILAREVTLSEIGEIKKNVPKVSLEYFVHGAMCMSYSGRCILSKWMTNRSANLGDCSQPCRWGYKEMGCQKNKTKEIEVVDDLSRFEMGVEEDRHGTYFFNSYDLNLLENVGDLMIAGVESLKIEGRAKSAYYVAVAVRAYRRVIDAIENKVSAEELKKIVEEQKIELDSLTNRGYAKGFLLGGEPEHNFSGKIIKGGYEFVGEVKGIQGELNFVKVHNAILLGDQVEAVTPEGNFPVKIQRILDDKKNEITEAHGGHDRKYFFEFDRVLNDMTIIRKIID